MRNKSETCHKNLRRQCYRRRKYSKGGKPPRGSIPYPSLFTCLCPTLPHAGLATLFPEAATKCLTREAGQSGVDGVC